jgi:hypothetical protein
MSRQTERPALLLNLDPKAMARFFDALERERRHIGLHSAPSRIEPRRRASLVELVLSLNFQSAWGAPEEPLDSLALMTRMFAPLLAESAIARQALNRALTVSLPGTFNATIPRRSSPAEIEASQAGDGQTAGVNQRVPEAAAPKPFILRPKALAAFGLLAIVIPPIGYLVWRRCSLDQSMCAIPETASASPAHWVTSALLTHWVPFVALCFALIGVLAAIWRSTRIGAAYLLRTVGNITGERVDIKAPVLGLESIATPGFADVARKMARRHRVPGRRLDADRTIRKSIAGLGFFLPRFKQKSVPTDYVFLLNRNARDDHSRDRVARIVDALRGAGVSATRYDYSNDPRVLFHGDEWDWERASSVMQLYDRQPDARIIVVSDGDELVNRVNFRPFAWARALSFGRVVGLLTPAMLREEGPASQGLASNLEWITERATLSGLGRLVDRFEQSGSRPTTRDAEPDLRIERPLPASLLSSQTRLLSDAVFDAAGQETLIADLRYFLGDDGFYWLAATALYPELRSDITIFLGLSLTERAEPNGRALFNEDRFLRIESLPWSRTGRFPDWIGWLLFKSMSTKEQRQAQDVIARMLAEARRAGGDSQARQIDAWVNFGEGESRPARITLSIWRQESQGAAIPRDSVALELLTQGGREDLLPLITGRTLHEILGTARRSLWAERAPVLLSAVAWILALLWLVPKPWVQDSAINSSTSSLVVTLVCALLVVVHAAHRYNTPETNRLTTTRTLFNLSRAGYVAASLALFFVLSEVLLKPGVFHFLGLDDIQTIATTYVSPPVLALTLLTAVFPDTPVVNAGDAWLLKYFQSLGRIPRGVRILADTLTTAELPLEESDLKELRNWILYDDKIPTDLAESMSTARADTSGGDFTRVLKLYFEVQTLEALPGYAASYRVRQDAWLAVQVDFRMFVTQSLVFFFYFNELNPKEGKATEKALNRAKNTYRDICGKMYRDMAEFLAQLLLMVEGSDASISNRLRSIGFRL